MKLKRNNNKGKQKTTTTTQQDLGSDLGDETKITSIGLKGKQPIASTSSLDWQNETPNEKRRIELFHIRVISKHNKIDTLFDTGF